MSQDGSTWKASTPRPEYNSEDELEVPTRSREEQSLHLRPTTFLRGKVPGSVFDSILVQNTPADSNPPKATFIIPHSSEARTTKYQPSTELTFPTSSVLKGTVKQSSETDDDFRQPLPGTRTNVETEKLSFTTGNSINAFSNLYRYGFAHPHFHLSRFHS